MVVTPRYLLTYDDNKFSVFETNGQSYDYDIISYCWGDEVKPYDCKIPGVTWLVKINERKITDIQKLMLHQGVKYLWADCVCLNKTDRQQEGEEIAKMFQYYKNARNCYLMIDMPVRFDTLQITEDLKLLDHILSNVGGASMVSDTKQLSPKLEKRRKEWAEGKPWVGSESYKSRVKAAGIDLGVMNCYNTCITQVISLFRNQYFTRVWTFQEMILGKNIEIVGVTGGEMSPIGSLFHWMELAYDCRDKAWKLYNWINNPRMVKNVSIDLVLAFIDIDHAVLVTLQRQMRGIDAAKTDIINGGQFWWKENPTGVSNIFSAISIIPRECKDMVDLFKGLLGIFSGLFTPEEIQAHIRGDDIEKISFAFFKKLSEKTGLAWTKLSIGSQDRGQWDWIPVLERDPAAKNADTNNEDEEDEEVNGAEEVNQGEQEERKEKNRIKTDIFAGVTNLGVLRKNGRAKTIGSTGLLGAPRTFMSIHLKEENPQFHFIFKGCNCGKKVKAGFLKKKTIPTFDEPTDIPGDETGRALAECATILGSLLDGDNSILDYKSRLLRSLGPQWETTDSAARPPKWPERCVSGTFWANEDNCRYYLRPHNTSMNLRMGAITSCDSRLAQGSTAKISCEVRINCGCVIIAPFSLIFEALTSVTGSSLGSTLMTGSSLDRTDEDDSSGDDNNDNDDGRIIMKDGLGLVQMGDLGKTFNVVAFGGHLDFHKSNATLCRKLKESKPVRPVKSHPRGRAIIRSDFKHGMANMMRDYGYVETGVGNLLISRDHILSDYKIRGVCIDNTIPQKKPGESRVMIQ
ncbi:hypothetical protein NUW58_g3364 [Xylaria curta]|uniref:Uncharacterized protein n=1 Tax=Xylaria curta TaxID=42375 RepID=A0ACC1PE26_9PEZI|nr:hypothetical protein NUW58_g3364 [Xylaria curta]